ncbi:MAG: hypothetical protein Q8909_21195 [Bacteroidota bacterium]|nr:hypothetical protein [Bacteroidota bacterium]
MGGSVGEPIENEYEEADDTDEITTDNQQLDEVIEFYDCYNLIPLAQRVIWLSNVKEALGYIPPAFELTHLEIKLLVVLQEEQSKKVAYNSYKMKQEQMRQMANMPNVPRR